MPTKTKSDPIFTSEYLGQPYSAEFIDFAPNVMDCFNLLEMKFFSLFTNNPFLIVNLLYILTFLFIIINSYFVMIYLKVNEYIASMLSLVYAFISYIFLRGIIHLSLSTYQFIPFAILLCIWVSKNEILIADKKKNTIAACIFCILIGMNGIAYYPFFACVLLLIIGLGSAIGNKNIKIMLKSIFCCALISSSMLICLLPNLLNIWKNGSTGISQRNPAEAEYLGLKIAQFFLPVNPDNDFVRYIHERYSSAPLPNEGSEYLGLVGMVGMIILLIGLFSQKRYEENNVLEIAPILQKLNIAAILVGTIGGLGSIFSVLISSQLRAYNRISIYVAFICILAVGAYSSYILEKISKNYKRIVFIVLLAFFSGLSIYNQIPMFCRNLDFSAAYTESDSDREFVSRIEEIIPEGMVFQLPFHPYPESGYVNAMADYEQFKPFLFSDSIKWSYGASRGRIGSVWNEMVSQLDKSEMLQVICEAGFSGIMINREAYSPEEWNALESEISLLTNESFISSNLGDLSFISLKEYRNKFFDGTAKLNSSVLSKNDSIRFLSGSAGIEGGGSWIWLDKKSEFVIYNFDEESIPDYTFSFDIISDFDGEYWVKVTANGVEKTYSLVNNLVSISETITLLPGENKFKIETNAPKVDAPGDPRELYIRMTNFDFSK